jgi:c(7)-type cytochrome triheme protein
MRSLVLFLLVLSSGGCSRRLLSVVVDLPENEAARRDVSASPAAVDLSSLDGLLRFAEDTIRPPIESTLDPDSVVSLLPRDHAGNIDWMAAIESGVIKPRSSLPGEPPKDAPEGFDFQFAFNFYFPGPNEMFDAYFPHEAHVKWLDCRQCHSRIFRYRGTEIQMADVLAGKYCGECHGKVAFPPTTGCERCHTALEQPANRAQPALLGTVTMKRSTEILQVEAQDELDEAAQADAAEDVQADSSIVGNAIGVRTNSLPVAAFPHWVHRIRFKCKTCHLEIFEPRAGTNAITMADIERGEKCGKCHNGTVAFAATLGTCQRCHVPPEEPIVAPDPENGTGSEGGG